MIFGELNAGIADDPLATNTIGLLVDTVAGTDLFSNNFVEVFSAHAADDIMIKIGTSASATSVRQNIWRLMGTTITNRTWLSTYEVGGIYDVQISNSGLSGTTGVHLQSSADKNIFRINNNCAIPVLDDSTSKQNPGVYGPIQPSISVHKNGAAQNNIVNNTATKVTWPTELFDTNGNFASDRFTPKAAGKYILTARVEWTTGVDGQLFYTFVYKNGAELHRASGTWSGTGGGEGELISVVVDANGSTDYFEVFARQVSGSNKNIAGGASSTYFTGILIGV